MKRITSIIVKSLFAILISGGLLTTAHAQYDPGITVDIPFAFSADGHEIAAGTYQLQLTDSNFLVSIRNVSTGKKQIITVRPEEARKLSDHARLTFQVCGGHNYLTEISTPGTTLSSATVPGHKHNDARTDTCSKNDAITVAQR
jgi:hypothetical protein